MKVIAEFVDRRNGKRYFPGDGNKIDPALDDEQIARLKAAQCLKEGDEIETRVKASADTEKSRLEAMNLADLKLLAVNNKIDLGDATKKADIVAAIEMDFDAKNLRSDGPSVGEWVAAGYKASAYPPDGYASKSSQDEIDAAVAVEKKPA